jgi:hypothetical protein
MAYAIQAFTAGMIDASPKAVAARAAHEIRNAARKAAWQMAIDGGATVLEADQAGQRAYWAKAAA